jgi:hypothetical protein
MSAESMTPPWLARKTLKLPHSKMIRNGGPRRARISRSHCLTALVPLSLLHAAHAITTLSSSSEPPRHSMTRCSRVAIVFRGPDGGSSVTHAQ